MTTYACIVCGRQFSEEAIRALVEHKRNQHAHFPSLFPEHVPDGVEKYPLCEDHGLRHLSTPETRRVLKGESLV